MDEFRYSICGSQAHNWSEEWLSASPKVPQCDRNITFPVLMIIYFLLVTTPQIIRLLCRKTIATNFINIIFISKEISSTALFIASLALLSIIAQGQDLLYVELTFPIVLTSTVIIQIFVCFRERRVDATNSGPYFCYWILLFVIAGLRSYSSFIERSESGILSSREIADHFVLAFATSSLLLSCFSDRRYSAHPSSCQTRLLPKPELCTGQRCCSCCGIRRDTHVKSNQHCAQSYPPEANCLSDSPSNFPLSSIGIHDMMTAIKHDLTLPKRIFVIDMFQFIDTKGYKIPFSSSDLPFSILLLAQSPERFSSFPTRLTFLWFTQLVYRSYKKTLALKDLWALDEYNQADHLNASFERHLRKYVVVEQAPTQNWERRRSSLGSSWLSGAPFSMDYPGRSEEADSSSALRRESTKSMIQSVRRHADSSSSTEEAMIQTSRFGSRKSNSSLSKPRRASDGASLSCRDSDQDLHLPPLSTSPRPDIQVEEVPSNHKEEEQQQHAVATTDSTGHLPLSATNSHGMDRKSQARRSVRIREGSKPLVTPGDSEDTHGAAQEEMLKREDPTAATPEQPPGQTEEPGVETKKAAINKDESEPFDCGLLKALFVNFWPHLLLAAIYKLCHDTLVFVYPMLLKYLLNFVQRRSLTQAVITWHGYVYAVGLLLVTVVQSLFLHQYFRLVFLIAMRMRTVVITAVYRKTLVLSAQSRKHYTSGAVTNLISNDAEKFLILLPFVNILWSGPFQISVSLALLWRELGFATFAGLIVLLLVLPSNSLMANAMKKIQERRMKLCDSRVKLINELLNGIKVVKLYAWEPPFLRDVHGLRSNEMHLTAKVAYMNSFFNGTWQFTPFLVSICSFGIFVLVSDEPLTAERAFVSITLFNILRFPLFMLPVVISNLMQFVVAVKRLTKFLKHAETNDGNVSHEDTPGVAAVIERGTFAWDPQGDPVLHNISLNFPDDQLSAVIGSVGSGKSSLLSALLGEMERFCGRVNVKNGVAYVPQQPWIFNATVRENILFHRPYDPLRYKRVVEACALLDDFDQLPAADNTEIGDKGINLSGGQKQRISLARACYADRDIYLLDDPLSAVDSHVARHLLNQVIGRSGLLARKTRIMTTNSRVALVHCDRVAVLEDGRRKESGTYRQLLQTRGSRLTAFLADSLRADSDAYRHQAKELKTKESLHIADDEFTHSSLSRINSLDSKVADPTVSLAESADKDAIICDVGMRSRKSSENQVDASSDRARTVKELDSHVLQSPEGGHCGPCPVHPCVQHHDQCPLAASATAMRGSRSQACHPCPHHLHHHIHCHYHAVPPACAHFRPTNGEAMDECIPMYHTDDFNRESGQLFAQPEERGIRRLRRLCRLIFRRRGQDYEANRQQEVVNPVRCVARHLPGETDSQAAPAQQGQSELDKGRIIREETVQVGLIKLSVFLVYMRNIGLLCCLHIFLLFAATQLVTLGSNIWLKQWSEDNDLVRINQTTRVPSVGKRVGIYALFGFLSLALTISANVVLAFGHLRGAVRLHNRLLESVLHAPMRFFDGVPTGRLMNRFSQDIMTMDEPLRQTVATLLTCMLQCVVTLGLTLWVSAWILVPIVAIGIIFFFTMLVYLNASRQLSRLQSVSKSPLYSHLQESMLGVESIRAYGMNDLYVRLNNRLLDLNNASYSAVLVSNRWLAVILETLSNMLVFLVAIVVVSTDASPGQSGLIISYLLNMTQVLNWTVRMCGELQANIISVERIDEYSRLEAEAPWEVPEMKPDDSWPRGQISFIKYSTNYRPGLPNVLHNLSFHIEAGQRVGIVGRTGSGKSTLVNALFRIVEAQEGQILIDELDISKIGLHEIRKRLTLIPQDPVLFKGTLRFNLDPFNENSDAQLWHMLEQANLKPFVQQTAGASGLDMEIDEGGKNISVGQRQMVCLTRALLRRSHVLVLDEATASVDPETDNLIQQTLQRQFVGSTVITIAHRINTIIDYDKVLVLSDGRVVEFDKPSVLMKNPDSSFADLVKEADIKQPPVNPKVVIGQ